MCVMSLRDVTSGEVWSVTRGPSHGQWSSQRRRCQDAEHSHVSRHFLVCTQSALPTPDLNNLRIRVSLPSHEDTVSGSGLAHNLQVPQYCQYNHDPHVRLKEK